MLHHHARLREGPQVKSPYRSEDCCVCVGAIGRGLRELRGFTEAAGRVDVHAGGEGRSRHRPKVGSSVCLRLDPWTPSVQYRTNVRFATRALSAVQDNRCRTRL